MIQTYFFGLVCMAALSCAAPRTDVPEGAPTKKNCGDKQEELGKLKDQDGDTTQDAPCGVRNGVDDDGIAPWHAVVKFDVIGRTNNEKSILGTLISPWHVLLGSFRFSLTLSSIKKGGRVGKVSKVYLNNAKNQKKVQRRVTLIQEISKKNYLMTLDRKVDLPHACWKATSLVVNKTLTNTYLKRNGEIREEIVQIRKLATKGAFYVTGRSGSATIWVKEEGRVKLIGFRGHSDSVGAFTPSTEHTIRQLVEKVA